MRYRVREGDAVVADRAVALMWSVPVSVVDVVHVVAVWDRDVPATLAVTVVNAGDFYGPDHERHAGGTKHGRCRAGRAHEPCRWLDPALLTDEEFAAVRSPGAPWRVPCRSGTPTTCTSTRHDRPVARVPG
jgi:hypothetical protein